MGYRGRSEGCVRSPLLLGRGGRGEKGEGRVLKKMQEEEERSYEVMTSSYLALFN